MVASSGQVKYWNVVVTAISEVKRDNKLLRGKTKINILVYSTRMDAAELASTAVNESFKNLKFADGTKYVGCKVDTVYPTNYRFIITYPKNPKDEGTKGE